METPRAAYHMETLLRLFQEQRFAEAMEYLADLDPEEKERLREMLHPGEATALFE